MLPTQNRPTATPSASRRSASRRSFLRGFTLISLLLLVALIVAACGGSSTPAPTSAPAPTTAPEPTAAPTAAPEPTEAVTESTEITATTATSETAPSATEAVSESATLSETAAVTETTATTETTTTTETATTTATASVYPTIELVNKPDVIRIGYQAIPNAELVAKQLKWHETSLGIPIEWHQFESGRDVNTAIASGSIDIGLVGSSPAANGISSDLPYQVIDIYDVIGGAEALAVRDTITSFDDLRGKTIAAPFGSTTHYSLLQVLKLHGISPDDVKLIDANPSDLLAAWTRGDIDAAYVWQPTLQKLYDDGGKKLIASDEVASLGFPTFDLAVATKDFTEKYPEVVALYLQDLPLRAVDLYRSDPEQATTAIATELDITPEDAAAQSAGLIWLTAGDQLGASYFGTTATPGALGGALKTTADFLVAQDVIPSAPDAPVFIEGVNPHFLELAAGK